MITKLGEVAGGVSGGKRGILSTKRLPSLPLRLIFCNLQHNKDKEIVL